MHLARALLAASLLLPCLSAQPAATPVDPAEVLEARVFESKKHGKLPYRMFAPKTTPVRRAKDAAPDASGPFPLVLFLHGAGERGDDNRRQLRHGVRDFVAPGRQAKRPCFVVAPQSPRGRWWDPAQVLEFLEAFMAEHPVDRDRVYVTGLSMGGHGTWQMIATAPELFAAAVPICGWGDVEKVAAMAKVPVWAFHGDADKVVPVEKTKVLVDALQKAGAQPKLTIYPGVNHDSWTATYRDEAVHAWLFGHTRPHRVAATPLKAGDRVVFFGDSITAAGNRGKGYIRLIEADLKERGMDVTLIGAGISGHKVPDLQGRLERDVLAHAPTVVMIYIGINDVWHWNNDRGTTKPDFASGLKDLVARITAKGARVVLCTPSVIGEKKDGANRFDAMLDQYAALTRAVARETGTQLLDLRRRFLSFLAENNPEDEGRGVLTGDRVHLNEKGNRFVADCMLEALGVAARRQY